MEKTQNTLGMRLAWIVVKDLQRAIDFYTNVLEFKVTSQSLEYGWVELSGADGATIGLAQENDHAPIKAGMNAIMTISVKNLEEAIKGFIHGGAKLVGEIEEIPGHVKMQTFQDGDGNILQLVEHL